MCSRLLREGSGRLDDLYDCLRLAFDALRYPVISIEDITTLDGLEQQTIRHFELTLHPRQTGTNQEETNPRATLKKQSAS